MALNNPWLGYIERTYEQSKKAIFDKMPFLIPEITDHTENDIFVKMISIWCGILEQLNYYIDAKAREVYLVTLRRFSSAVKFARGVDYRVKGTNNASVELRFFINAPALVAINIPIGTEVTTKEGIQFFTTSAAVIPIGSLQVIVPASQRIARLSIEIGTTTNEKSQIFSIEEGVVDSSIEIVTNAENYTPLETLSFAESTDKVFFATINEEGVMTIEFGDGVNGAIPVSGQPVFATYYISSGALGNVGPEQITELVSTIVVPSGIILRVSNIFEASGGVSTEDTKTLQRRIPQSIRTNFRAVTDQDYIDIAELVNGVAKAGVTYECKNPVDVYIVPNGGGEASSTLKKSVENYFEDKRINTTRVRVLSAGDVRIQFEIDVYVSKNSNRIETTQRALENLLDLMSEENQLIKGKVNLGDIYEVLENTRGVNNTEVRKMTTKSSAIALDSAPILLWDRETLVSSNSVVKWRITILSLTQFQLFRENQFQGVFLIGAEVTTPEIKFTINPNGYSISDTWSFITYPYFGTVQIADMSIPTTKVEDVIINAIGGI